MEKEVKSDLVYNHWDNVVYVKSQGDEIHIICDKEKQLDRVVERITTPQCTLAGYEEWDEDEDKKWILKFVVCDSEFEMVPEYN